MNMQLNAQNQLARGRRVVSDVCRACYTKVAAQIRVARETILAEARKGAHAHERLLRLAVNEAEALAWQTLYPQLVFPDLAAEKIQGVARWTARQRSLT